MAKQAYEEAQDKANDVEKSLGDLATHIAFVEVGFKMGTVTMILEFLRVVVFAFLIVAWSNYPQM
jgi:hypothetical protein